MPKFIIRDTVPCYVTWPYVVEAEDEEMALENFCQGDQGEPQGDAVIGNVVGRIDGFIEVSAFVELPEQSDESA